jgi:hypothetical protein
LEVYQAIMNGDLEGQDFEGPRYNRVACLQQLLGAGRVDAHLRWRETDASHQQPVRGQPARGQPALQMS